MTTLHAGVHTADMNNTTDTTTENRRAAATAKALERMHRLWHEIRSLPVCERLACEHPWAP